MGLMKQSNANTNIKFMSVVLNCDSLMIGCYKVISEYKTKQLMPPKIHKIVALNKVIDEFMNLFCDTFGSEMQNEQASKMDEAKLKFLNAIQCPDNDEEFSIFD